MDLSMNNKVKLQNMLIYCVIFPLFNYLHFVSLYCAVFSQLIS